MLNPPPPSNYMLGGGGQTPPPQQLHAGGGPGPPPPPPTVLMATAFHCELHYCLTALNRRDIAGTMHSLVACIPCLFGILGTDKIQSARSRTAIRCTVRSIATTSALCNMHGGDGSHVIAHLSLAVGSPVCALWTNKQWYGMHVLHHFGSSCSYARR